MNSIISKLIIYMQSSTIMRGKFLMTNNLEKHFIRKLVNQNNIFYYPLSHTAIAVYGQIPMKFVFND